MVIAILRKNFLAEEACPAMDGSNSLWAGCMGEVVRGIIKQDFFLTLLAISLFYLLNVT